MSRLSMRKRISERSVLLLTFLTITTVLLSWQQESEGFAAPVLDLDWETPQRVSLGATIADSPALRMANNGVLYIAYDNDMPGGGKNPYYVRSTDEGLNWSEPAPIRTGSGNLDHVTLAIDNNNVAHAVWRTGSGLAHAARSAWPSGTVHTVVATSDIVREPYLAVGGDNVLHLVWAQNASGLPHKIFHAYSSNGGANWSTPQVLASDAEHSSVPVAAVDSSNNVHVVWEESIFDVDQPGFYRYEVYYKKGTKSGSGYSWDSSPNVLSGNMSRAQRPAILAQGNVIHVSFARQNPDQEQFPYYIRYTPSAGWSTPLDVSRGNPLTVNTNSPFYLITTLASCNNGLFIYFHGSSETNAREQLWGASSVDDWIALDIATTSDTRSVNPSLVCAGRSLYMAFEQVESAGVNHQVYFTASRYASRVLLPVIKR